MISEQQKMINGRHWCTSCFVLASIWNTNTPNPFLVFSSATPGRQNKALWDEQVTQFRLYTNLWKTFSNGSDGCKWSLGNVKSSGVLPLNVVWSDFELKFNKLHLREESVNEFHISVHDRRNVEDLCIQKYFYCFHSNSTLAFTNMKCFLLIQENIPD